MSQFVFDLAPAGVDAEASMAIQTAMKACLRPGAPLPIIRVLSVTVDKNQFGKSFYAHVEMFDGCEGVIDIGRWSPEPDAWRFIWVDLGGDNDPIVIRRGRWRRCTSVERSEAS